MKKLLLISLILLFTGCAENDKKKLDYFNQGKLLICPGILGHVAVTNKNWKYSYDSNRVYNEDLSTTFLISNCDID